MSRHSLCFVIRGVSWLGADLQLTDPVLYSGFSFWINVSRWPVSVAGCVFGLKRVLAGCRITFGDVSAVFIVPCAGKYGDETRIFISKRADGILIGF